MIKTIDILLYEYREYFNIYNNEFENVFRKMGYNSNYYWLRSPSRYASTEVTTVSSINGSFNSVTVTTTTAGVGPACYVKLPS